MIFALFCNTFLIVLTVFFPGTALYAEEKPPVAIETSHIVFQPHVRPIRTSGILAYKRKQTLAFKTAGPIEQLLVEEGDPIKAGQQLANLDLSEISARVAEASARTTQAQRNLDRYRQLHSTNALSLDALQLAETELRVAESQLRIAKFNQEYSVIRAPSDGLVLKRHVEEKELVTPNQPIVMIADESQGWIIRTGVTDREIARIQKGDAARISFDALPGQTFQGSVTQLGVIGNEKTGTFEIEISLTLSQVEKAQENTPHEKLRAGFVSKIVIQPSTSNNVALIPITSIIHADQSSSGQTEVFVYNPESQIAELRPVSVEYIEGGMVAISDGLTETDALITTGAGLLRQGEKARVITGE